MLWLNGSISCPRYVIFLVVVPIPVVSKIWYTERVREHVNRSLLPFTLIDNEELLRDAAENIIFNWLIYDVGEPIDRKGNARTGAKKWNSDDGADGRKKKPGQRNFQSQNNRALPANPCRRYNFWVWYFLFLYFFFYFCISCLLLVLLPPTVTILWPSSEVSWFCPSVEADQRCLL